MVKKVSKNRDGFEYQNFLGRCLYSTARPNIDCDVAKIGSTKKLTGYTRGKRSSHIPRVTRLGLPGESFPRGNQSFLNPSFARWSGIDLSSAPPRGPSEPQALDRDRAASASPSSPNRPSESQRSGPRALARWLARLKRLAVGDRERTSRESLFFLITSCKRAYAARYALRSGRDPQRTVSPPPPLSAVVRERARQCVGVWVRAPSSRSPASRGFTTRWGTRSRRPFP